jgi:hypothetical protein
MKTLRKINENNFIIYHIQTDLDLIIKVKTDASLSEYGYLFDIRISWHLFLL